MNTVERKIENEALRLFEFGLDDEFRRRQSISLDSSLGVLPEPRGDEARENHKH